LNRHPEHVSGSNMKIKLQAETSSV